MGAEQWILTFSIASPFSQRLALLARRICWSRPRLGIHMGLFLQRGPLPFRRPRWASAAAPRPHGAFGIRDAAVGLK